MSNVIEETSSIYHKRDCGQKEKVRVKKAPIKYDMPESSALSGMGMAPSSAKYIPPRKKNKEYKL